MKLKMKLEKYLELNKIGVQQPAPKITPNVPCLVLIRTFVSSSLVLLSRLCYVANKI